MSAEAGSANAALLLAAVVFCVAMPKAPEAREHCELPFERAADALSGFTTEVGCDPAVEPRPPIEGPARLLFGLRLDVNRASEKALEALPAIGPARAAAIVRARTDRRFESLAELERVPGIGWKTREGLAGWAGVALTPAAASEGGMPEGGGGVTWPAR